MKNKKGFTMVELLAVIVILGILMGVALPKVLGLLDSNKKKTYIQDAKKLISRAQYMVTSENTKIDKPDPDDCIVLSLGFLDDGSFDSPPNKGEYLSENSFVLVKNIGNNDYEYSAMLIEKYKESNYYGVMLSTLNQLNATNAGSRVKKISNYTNYGVDNLDRSRINTAIGIPDYIKSTAEIIDVYKMYNYEEKSNTEIFKPEISNVKITEINANEVQINVEATDRDSDKLCIAYDMTTNNKKLNYPKVPAKVNFSSCTNMEANGENSFKYTSGNINVKSYKPGPMWFLITIYDGDKKYVNKAVKHSFYANKAPVIESFTINKRPNDVYNMNTARLELKVSDDLDSSSDLNVCISEDSNCDDFVRYSELFSRGYYDYKLSESLDGSSHTLHVFVKDSSNLMAEKTSNSYTVYTNTAPRIKSVTLSPKKMSDVFSAASSSSKNSLQSDLTIDVEDDITDPEDLYIIIDESGRSISSRSSRYDGLHFKTSNSYVFSGNYDGTDRLLKIKVCDDTDLCSGYTSKTLDNVFTNDVPVISNNISVKSHLDGFNSKYVEIDTSQLNVTDDLNDFEVTLCTKIGGAENCREYNSLDDFKAIYTKESDDSETPFVELNISEYNAQTALFYVKVKDNYDQVVEGIKVPYKLYKMCTTVDSIDDYSFLSGTEINASACGGMCYDHGRITARYKKSLYNVDRYVYDINTSTGANGQQIVTYNYNRCTGSTGISETNVNVNCSFYKCAGEQGTNSFAVGTKLFDVPVEDQWDEALLDEDGNQVYVDEDDHEVTNASDFYFDNDVKNYLVSKNVRALYLNDPEITDNNDLKIVDDSGDIIVISASLKNKLIDSNNQFIIYDTNHVRLTFDSEVTFITMDADGKIMLFDSDNEIIDHKSGIRPVVCKCDKYYRFYNITVYSYYAVARPINPCEVSLCSCIYSNSKKYNSTKNLYTYNSDSDKTSYMFLNDSTSSSIPSSGLIQIDDSDFTVDLSCKRTGGD